MATTVNTGSAPVATAPTGQRSRGRRATGHHNWLGGAAGWLWLVVVLLPIYWIVITSFKTQSNYFTINPLAPPSDPTLDNYRLVIESDFIRYFINSVVVVVGAFGSTVVVANSVVVVTSVAAEPLSPRLINHTIPEIATATMGMRMMYMPVRLRLSLRAWRANSSKRC